MRKNRRMYLLAAIVLVCAAGITALLWMDRSDRDEQVNGQRNGDQTKVMEDTPSREIEMISSDNGIRIELEEGTLTYEVRSPETLRVHFVPKGAEMQDSLLLKPEDEQDGFREDGEDFEVTVNLDAQPMKISTSEMTVEIDPKTYRYSVYDHSDKLLVQDGGSEVFSADAFQLAYEGEDAFYGFKGYSASDSSDDLLLRDGGGYITAGQQGGAGAPFMWSTDGYGVLVDTISGSIWMKEGAIEIDRLSEPDLEYFILVGDPNKIMEQTAALTGTYPMFPKWAMGFFNFEWGIDQTELVQLVDTYREKNIPIDSFTLDFDWKAWGEDQYGEFRWNEEKFPDGSSGKLKEMMDARGIKLTGILKPRIHALTEQGKYAEENGFWWPNKSMYKDYFSRRNVNDVNFALPEVREWFWTHTKPAFETGLVGWWNDEADVGYDNVQFMNMQRAMYDGQRRDSELRVWSINRNFYLGSQRYAYGLWSGDIETGFKSMAEQRERMLSAINVGAMKWGMDTGGFKGTPQPENYARWMQFSAFTPIFRVHGEQDEQRQPWVYGEQAEKVASAAIRLRYELIPYIYAYERQAYETGLGLVKPLLFDYPDDPNVRNRVDAWMFGDYLLVSPVVEQGQESKLIYLPEGTWIDYFRGDRYEGGQEMAYALDAQSWEDIPLFIKEGAIIPTQPVMNYVGEQAVEQLNIDLFPAQQTTTFELYDDDGRTYDYEDKAYSRQQIELTGHTEGVQIKLNHPDPDGTYTPSYSHILLQVHGVHADAVEMNGEQLDQVSEEQLEKAGMAWAKAEDTYGEVTFIRVEAGSQMDLTLTVSP
ncbi:glycoside hydrolase family 31 protein [Marinicrinis sediminis]|uniref:TIM-barrel domain-containing protein n=1 Tax=Marinicrinis sediminis TaxID=1652465 RepID=A0ABW5RAP3_9BACL